MPKWVTHMLWALLAIALLARWRDLAAWIRSLGGGIGRLFSGETSHFDDPVYRFAAFGLALVTIVALFALWVNRSRRSP